jgi:enoyl-CoA hydratase
MAEPLLLQIEGLIATITFNRPERRNAITFDMWNHLQRLFVDVKANPQVRVVVLRGAGQEAFAAGADISEFETHRNNAAKATLYNAAFDAAMDMAEAVGKPTICLIMGACVGGGCELSTACDIRIAADNASFGVPSARLGKTYAAVSRLLNADREGERHGIRYMRTALWQASRY